MISGSHTTWSSGSDDGQEKGQELSHPLINGLATDEPSQKVHSICGLHPEMLEVDTAEVLDMAQQDSWVYMTGSEADGDQESDHSVAVEEDETSQEADWSQRYEGWSDSVLLHEAV